jgi:hypothetical protein
MRTSTRLLLLAAIAAVPLLLGGCMMGMHGGDHGGGMPARTIVKELSSEGIILSLDAPRPAAGKETELVLKAERIRDGAPVTGGRASFVIPRPEGGAEVEREAVETQPGTYAASYRFDGHGPYRVTARLATAEQPERPLTITVGVEAGDHGGKKGSTLWMVLGGIGMAAMMLVVML